ncbi:MAG: hypothetical protein P0107_03295 [Nitrosomonas sp.]|nr:hypothetical protein [Nitrosomonas sp.]
MQGSIGGHCQRTVVQGARYAVTRARVEDIDCQGWVRIDPVTLSVILGDPTGEIESCENLVSGLSELELACQVEIGGIGIGTALLKENITIHDSGIFVQSIVESRRWIDEGHFIARESCQKPVPQRPVIIEPMYKIGTDQHMGEIPLRGVGIVQ